MSCTNWVVTKFAGLVLPVLPVLIQSYKVTSALEGTLQDILKQLVPEGKAYADVKSVLDADTCIKSALAKAIVFLGGIIPVTQASTSNLKDEVDKLKKLL